MIEDHDSDNEKIIKSDKEYDPINEKLKKKKSKHKSKEKADETK